MAPEARWWHALRQHWPEYAIEGALLGGFMLAACLATAAVEYPASPIRLALDDAVTRRGLIGVLMGATAIALIYSRWGLRSGAHFNPAVTVAFFWLGKVEPWDALFYVLAHLVGGAGGVLVAAIVLGDVLGHPSVNWVVTVPGTLGALVAFAVEVLISFGLMIAVLASSNSVRFARFTGVLAGTLVATYIVLAAPLSGMSMNPARTLASALPARIWTAWWVYLSAPFLGMLAAAEVFRALPLGRTIFCAKLVHLGRARCIFRCGYEAPESPGARLAGPSCAL